MSSTETPKIIGLRGIHSPEALKHQTGLSFCPWCGKEGQNEGTVVNHLCTRHYHLGLICERCLLYFMTSLDTMQHHAQGCQSTCGHDGKPNGESDRTLWYHLDRSSLPKSILWFMPTTLIATSSREEDACHMGFGNPWKCKSKMIKPTQKWNKSRLKCKLPFVFILMHHMKWLY